MDALFLVEEKDNKTLLILGKLEKWMEGYQYTPSKLANESTFRWASKAFTSNVLPPFVQQRIFSKHNIALNNFLKTIKLDHYDQWEILKRTKGASPRDGLKFLTKNEIIKKYSQFDKNDIKKISLAKKRSINIYSKPIIAIPLLNNEDVKKNLGLFSETEMANSVDSEPEKKLKSNRIKKPIVKLIPGYKMIKHPEVE